MADSAPVPNRSILTACVGRRWMGLLSARVLVVCWTAAVSSCGADRAYSDVGGGFDTCPRSSGDQVSLGRLLEELVDLEHLARRADPSYVSRLASSFNQVSRTSVPGDPEWFADHDVATFEPNKPVVLLHVEGPGVVTRIWSANPSGLLRVYIDGNAEPVIEAPMKAVLSGEVFPFGKPFGSVAAGGGYNLYFPIPFQSQCRITTTSDAAGTLYYNVDYRQYDSSAMLEPFSIAALTAVKCQRELAARRLSALATRDGSSTSTARNQQMELVLGPGDVGEKRFESHSGGSAVNELRAIPSTMDAATLRGTILSIAFDGHETVRTPLGDFFGTGPGPGIVNSLPTQVDPRAHTLSSRWPMPFRTEMTITLTNTSRAPLSVRFELSVVPRQWDEDTLLFHAQWHPPQWQDSEPPHDWPLITINGTGTYVGTVLNVINTSPGWWGEGEEKIFIDGERFPSHFGTGTEDYFGFAWCSTALFSTPYIGQTHAGARKNWGAISLYRFHVLDAIPFTSQLRFDLEVNHWGDSAVQVEYDSVVYYYAEPGASAEPVAADPSVYRVPILPPEPTEILPSLHVCGSG